MGFLKNIGTEEAAHNTVGQIGNVIGRVGDAFNAMNGAPQTYGAFRDNQQAHWDADNAKNAFGALITNPEDQNAFGMLAKANPALAIQFMGALKKQAVEPTNTEKVFNFLKGQLGDAGAQDYLRNISMGTPVAVYSYDEQGNPIRQFLPRSVVTGQGQPQAPQAPASAVQNVPVPASSVPSGSPLAGAPNAKVIGGKQYWQVNGKWYDNPEGK